MSAVTEADKYSLQHKLVSLARELAYDMKSLPDILKELSISTEEYDVIRKSAVFNNILAQEIANWGSALNTQERVKLKTQSMIELSLEEFYARMHDKDEPLSAKVALLQTLTKIAGMDANKQEVTAGERFQVTINLGADQKLVIDKPAPTHKVIDGEVL